VAIIYVFCMLKTDREEGQNVEVPSEVSSIVVCGSHLENRIGPKRTLITQAGCNTLQP
jgi:hypothetical protein